MASPSSHTFAPSLRVGMTSPALLPAISAKQINSHAVALLDSAVANLGNTIKRRQHRVGPWIPDAISATKTLAGCGAPTTLEAQEGRAADRNGQHMRRRRAPLQALSQRHQHKTMFEAGYHGANSLSRGGKDSGSRAEALKPEAGFSLVLKGNNAVMKHKTKTVATYTSPAATKRATSQPLGSTKSRLLLTQLRKRQAAAAPQLERFQRHSQVVGVNLLPRQSMDIPMPILEDQGSSSSSSSDGEWHSECYDGESEDDFDAGGTLVRRLWPLMSSLWNPHV